jgi:autoinducer 2-degrading protein
VVDISLTDELDRSRAREQALAGYHLCMFILNVHIHVLPEHLEAFKQATIVNASNSVKEPGVVRFDFMQAVDDPTVFGLYEVYRDREAVAAHKETAHYKAWADKVEGWFAEPRTRVFYESVFPENQDW